MDKRPVLRLALAVLVGLGLGYGSTAGALLWTASRIGLYNPAGWMTARGIGGSEADPVLKALIARIGIFANSREEAVYFQGYVDNPRRKLTGDGRYRIEGSVRLPAEWWSITLYNSRELLHPNPQRRYSFASFNLQTAEDGSFAIDVAPERPPGAANWLPSPPGESFSLTLRVYRPQPQLLDHLESYPLPRLSRVP